MLVVHEFADLGGIGVDDTNHTNLNLREETEVAQKILAAGAYVLHIRGLSWIGFCRFGLQLLLEAEEERGLPIRGPWL